MSHDHQSVSFAEFAASKWEEQSLNTKSILLGCFAAALNAFLVACVIDGGPIGAPLAAASITFVIGRRGGRWFYKQEEQHRLQATRQDSGIEAEERSGHVLR